MRHPFKSRLEELPNLRQADPGKFFFKGLAVVFMPAGLDQNFFNLPPGIKYILAKLRERVVTFMTQLILDAGKNTRQAGFFLNAKACSLLSGVKARLIAQVPV